MIIPRDEKQTLAYKHHREVVKTVRVKDKQYRVFYSTMPRSFYLSAQYLKIRWAEVCNETIHSIPSIFVFSASWYAKKKGVSHVTAKKLLRNNPRYYQLSPRVFTINYSGRKKMIIEAIKEHATASMSPGFFVSLLERVRSFDGIPTRRNIALHLGLSTRVTERFLRVFFRNVHVPMTNNLYLYYFKF